MKVLGIIGSPRADGNTDLLVSRLLVGAAAAGAHTEKVRLGDLNYRPCDGCESCKPTGVCVIDDDLQPVHRKLTEADALVLGSPIYWHGLTAQTKALIDRCQCFWNLRTVLRKAHAGARRPAIFVSLGGQRQPRFELAIPTVKLWFSVLGFAYTGQLLVPNLDSPGEIVRREDVWSHALEIGRDLAVRR
ncbi:MAG: flavodoxin family protein [Chloroflexi bacterium]|nr:flavodoxin family protein [Chloroflexota bacterium]